MPLVQLSVAEVAEVANIQQVSNPNPNRVEMSKSDTDLLKSVMSDVNLDNVFSVVDCKNGFKCFQFKRSLQYKCSRWDMEFTANKFYVDLDTGKIVGNGAYGYYGPESADYYREEVAEVAEVA